MMRWAGADGDLCATMHAVIAAALAFTCSKANGGARWIAIAVNTYIVHVI